MNDLDIQLASASWAMKQTSQLLKEYKHCKTQKGKLKIIDKMRSLQVKMSYERDQLDKIINGSR